MVAKSSTPLWRLCFASAIARSSPVGWVGRSARYPIARADSATRATTTELMNVLAADTPTDLMPSDIESPLRLRRRRQAATVPRGWQSVASLDGAERSVLGARLDEAHHASAAGALAPPAL